MKTYMDTIFFAKIGASFALQPGRWPLAIDRVTLAKIFKKP